MSDRAKPSDKDQVRALLDRLPDDCSYADVQRGIAVLMWPKQGDGSLAPPKDRHMLPGITYDLILELAAANAIPVEIGYFDEARIRAADELWITSSTKEVLAIVTLDGRPIGNGKPGPMFHRMYQYYQDYKNQVMRHG